MGVCCSKPLAVVYKMGALTIRNLTITPLELKAVERLEPAPPSFSSPPHGTPSGLAKITARLTGRGGGAAHYPLPIGQPHRGNGHAILPGAFPGDDESGVDLVEQQPPPAPPPAARKVHELNGVLIQPFSELSLPDDITPPDVSRSEQLRMTFSEPGSSDQYIADVPSSSPPRSIVMKSPSSDKEFTLIYIPSHAFLSIFSSTHLSSWMSELFPALPLSALSIPGTHNSPTRFVALPSVRCQAVSVGAQLDNGVRFLDVRVSCPSSSNSEWAAAGGAPDLALVHSAFPISLSGTKYFHDLLTEVYAFLADHPSETVLVSIKREGTGRGTDQQLSKHLASRYCVPAERWWTEPRIPTLGEARGRMVLVRRFHVDESLAGKGFGIDGSVWPDNCADGTCGSGMIRIQDYYDLGQAEEIAKKITFAQSGLEKAAQPDSTAAEASPGVPAPLYINFLSASNFFNASCWPEKIAAKLNPAIIEYLCMGHGAPGKGPGQLTIGDAATGIVVTDWVGNKGDWDLIRCIVGWNARLQLKQ
ncbi:PLC-like phosphodiesterase [Podospora didyma]|uniref:PLC-like phosphodiesterase n=1 Tax=Podospora didyma TaxID=330526 RepID=A0AAE0P784_9PEZI|nr:PLC-like phosphodiesterase [Podospora didyma]